LFNNWLYQLKNIRFNYRPTCVYIVFFKDTLLIGNNQANKT